MSLKLGVNIDHVATLRQARGTQYPSPLHAALLAEEAGADAITLHLREDRRHINDNDVRTLRGMLTTRMNLEMAVTAEMLDIACEVLPQDVCLVPERREEVTTEGGLDVAGQFEKIADACTRLTQAGMRVSLFVDAESQQIEAAKATGAPVIEIHTGRYAETDGGKATKRELVRVQEAVEKGVSLGLIVNAGHGLHYHNVQAIAAIPGVEELNIGHAIVSHAIFSGLESAIREMKRLMKQARRVKK